MTDTSVNPTVDTLKSIAGIVGIQATQGVADVTTTDIGHLMADITTGLIAFLTLANLIKSLFFSKK